VKPSWQVMKLMLAVGTFAGFGIDVGTSADAARKQTEHPVIAAPETPTSSR
jgi:hypothetical protein